MNLLTNYFFYSALTISTLYILSIEEQDISQNPIHGQSLLFFVALSDSTASPTMTPSITIPEVNFCDILPCDKTYCCSIHQTHRKAPMYQTMTTKEESKLKYELLLLLELGIDTTISSMQILETQQKIDRRYCNKGLQCSTTEPLIIFQCKVTFGNICSHQPRNQNRREAFQETTQDLANCSTDPNYAGIFFTDYYFYFYRQCN
uniref:Myelin regulatory factor like n=1 Tax=Chelonoidis abingdonii TaxID=106734 RepID=A0A8C0H7N9_CHEAB